MGIVIFHYYPHCDVGVPTILYHVLYTIHCFVNRPRTTSIVPPIEKIEKKRKLGIFYLFYKVQFFLPYVYFSLSNVIQKTCEKLKNFKLSKSRKALFYHYVKNF